MCVDTFAWCVHAYGSQHFGYHCFGDIHLLLCRQGLSLAWNLTKYSRRPRNPLVPTPPQQWDDKQHISPRPASSKSVFWGSSSGPHARMAGPSLTEPSLNAENLHFLNHKQNTKDASVYLTGTMFAVTRESWRYQSPWVHTKMLCCLLPPGEVTREDVI